MLRTISVPTTAPASRRTRTVSAPIPRRAPVTTAILPSRRNGSVMLREPSRHLRPQVRLRGPSDDDPDVPALENDLVLVGARDRAEDGARRRARRDRVRG